MYGVDIVELINNGNLVVTIKKKAFFPKLYSVNLAFIPVFKPHTHKLYIVIHCTNIVYV